MKEIKIIDVKDKSNNVEVDNILMELKVLKNQKEFINARISLLECDLLKICTHPNPIMKKRHEEGDYYNRSHTYEYAECPVCGIRSEERLVHTGEYG